VHIIVDALMRKKYRILSCKEWIVRLWSLHPMYLDSKGLVALWREGLLARSVLMNQTRGYKYHPQLNRFRENKKPIVAIDQYLWGVYEEGIIRGYHFNINKLGNKIRCAKIAVFEGQIQFEWEHLAKKLRVRNFTKYKENKAITHPLPHPIFKIEPGGVAIWEKLTEPNT
jgi:hypothetical protein